MYPAPPTAFHINRLLPSVVKTSPGFPSSGGNVYVVDTGNIRIRKITSSGVVTTFAGNGSVGFTNGTGTNATFNRPIGVAVDSAGNVYVADSSNHRIRKITSAGVVTTLAGNSLGYVDGTGTNAGFEYPKGIMTEEFEWLQ